MSKSAKAKWLTMIYTITELQEYPTEVMLDLYHCLKFEKLKNDQLGPNCKRRNRQIIPYK